MIQDFLVVGSNSALLLKSFTAILSKCNLKDDSKGKLLLKLQIISTVSSGVCQHEG
jgi:hypothetical protein